MVLPSAINLRTPLIAAFVAVAQITASGDLINATLHVLSYAE